MRNILLTIFSIAFAQLFCQDVEQKFAGFRDRWIKDPILIGGSIGFNSTYYNSGYSSDNNIPFMYNAFGDVQMDILGISAPLSFFYSNQNIQYRLPAYKFVGISPSYRGQTLLLGDRSMNLSPYSFAGIGFTGIGVESIIGRFTVKGMYGRLNKATINDAFTLNDLENKFRRVGWAIGGEYKDDKQMFGIHLFQAKDDPETLPAIYQENITPQAGSIFVIKGSKKIGVTTLKAEYAYNLLTKNLNVQLPYSGHSVFGLISGWHESNSSTGSFKAFNSAIDVNLKKVKLGLAYERIDPGYISLGALFFNNDMETISGNISLPTFKGKVNSMLSIGTQRNNLDRDQANDFRRLVTSFQTSLQLGKTTRVNLFASNFRFSQKSYLNTQPFIDVDTLLLSQNNFNSSVNIIQNFGKTSSLLFTIAHNRSHAIQGDSVISSSEIRNSITQLYYQRSIEKRNTRLSAGINYNNLNFSAVSSTMIGPALAISIEPKKDFWTVSFSETLLFTKNELSDQTILRSFLTNKFKLLNSIDFDIQLMYLTTISSEIADRNDLMINALIIYRLENKILVKSFKRNKHDSK